ncbi:MAG: cell envelope-related function transcriptional attenuator, LytR/CpsA family protein nonfunctional [Candidatus Saccharibacteria bacterium]|nr:cell envelope-related function transcriptional attenuator, LytR/CpsA family protein nonfunctional [Candidatus Saccharibacteria bacterium]
MAYKKKIVTATPANPTFDLHRTLPNPTYGSTAVAGAPVKRRDRKLIFKRIMATLLILLLFVGGFLGWKLYSNSSKVFDGNIFGLLQSTKLDGEDVGRVNLLLIGNSADDPNHGGAQLTDSIMIVSINTATNKAFLISVPRDLYVEIPDNGYAKINETYQDGERDGYEGGGAALLESLLEERLGININYYALVNYTAFRDTVNALGGIQVTINSTSKYGIYDPNISKVDGGPLKLANGTQTLNGQTALNLARARGAAGGYGLSKGDFDRTANQRMMLVALKDKAASASTLSNPIKVAALLDALGNNVKTDMNTSEARRLYDISKKIASSDIASASLNGTDTDRLLTGYTTRTGQSALIPVAGVDDYSDIQSYIDQLLSTN